jgi:hypothetical protein
MSVKMAPHKKKKISKEKRSAYILSGVVIAMMLIRLVAGLVRPTPTAASRTGNAVAPTTVATHTPSEIAASTLETFFNLLHDHRYAEATTYYGGSYEDLAALNPDDADSHANLLKDACTTNGYQCLTVKSVSAGDEAAADTYSFNVEFGQADGSFLVRPSGETGIDAFAFPFTVKHVGDDYLVQDLPVQ